MTTDETAVSDPPAGHAGTSRALVAVGAVVAILLGFLAGFLVKGALDGPDAAPAADSVDVGFAHDMIVHHDQAVQMAAIALTSSQDVPVRNLAYDILTTQQNQIGQMQGWLALWNQPSTSTAPHMTWMEGDGHDHTGGHGGTGHDTAGPMPGMATTDDMNALRAATGRDQDVRFLQLMLRHHEGGLAMMEYGAQHAQTEPVRNLAQTMVDTQTGESALMTSMLRERGAEPLPMN